MICTEERFIPDIAKHAMQVMHDDGVYRHLRFQNPETFNQWFELITWPGHLCISGDVASYVFTRLEDMFEFFRCQRDDGELHINDYYWAEKLVAQDCHGRYCEGVKRWDSQAFELAIKERYDEHVREEMQETPDDHQELWTLLEEEVLLYSEDKALAMSAACDFDEYGLNLEDFYETDCTRWNYNFIWCLYAIAWGIRQYDALKHREEVKPEEVT